jgi:CarD family transcriptional regulator
MAQTARSTRSSSRFERASAKARPTTVAPKTKPSSKPALRAVKAEAPTAKVAPTPKQGTVRAAEPRAARPGPAPAPAMPKTETTSAPAAAVRPSTIVPKGYVPLVNIPPLPPPPKNLKLEVGDKAVHPSHGLGEIIAIEHREIGGAKGEFFILRILDNGMRVMVPRTSAQAAGLRPVMSSKEAEKVLETMRAREVAVDLQPWSRRFRAYTEMIKSGSPHEVAKVLRDMYRLKFDKELSFGERRLLDQAKSLLMKELAAAKGVTEAVLQGRVDEMFRT